MKILKIKYVPLFSSENGEFKEIKPEGKVYPGNLRLLVDEIPEMIETNDNEYEKVSMTTDIEAMTRDYFFEIGKIEKSSYENLIQRLNRSGSYELWK